jgi:hypothetical protein
VVALLQRLVRRVTKVVHWRRTAFDVFIGRTDEKMHFGNPFTMKEGSRGSVMVGSRAEAIENFELWLSGASFQDVEPERREWILENLDQLRGKRLGCWCKPKACHGDVYVSMIHLQDYLEY